MQGIKGSQVLARGVPLVAWVQNYQEAFLGAMILKTAIVSLDHGKKITVIGRTGLHIRILISHHGTNLVDFIITRDETRALKGYQHRKLTSDQGLHLQAVL